MAKGVATGRVPGLRQCRLGNLVLRGHVKASRQVGALCRMRAVHCCCFYAEPCAYCPRARLVQVNEAPAVAALAPIKALITTFKVTGISDVTLVAGLSVKTLGSSGGHTVRAV